MDFIRAGRGLLVAIIAVSCYWSIQVAVYPAITASESPVIKDLAWGATKTVNDKVYEGVVVFEAVDNVPIRSARLVWTPVKYANIPDRAFPAEDPKSIDVMPIDGKFNGADERFSYKVSDIIGGREYDIKAVVEDTAGNVREKTLSTPYIRQFENIAKTDNVTIGAYYYPWYGQDRLHWNEGYTGTPLLGEYDSRDPIAISRQIDWATGYGIDFFILSWWGPDSYEDITIKDSILTNPLANEIKFTLLYESLGRLNVIKNKNNDITIDINDGHNRDVLNKDLSYISEQYLNRENILKIDDKPVVEIFLPRIFTGDIHGEMDNLRSISHAYLLGDVVYWDNPYDRYSIEKIGAFDGITDYNPHTNRQEILSDFENRLDNMYGQWYGASKSMGVDFIPSIIPGYNDKALKDRNTLPLQRSVDRFKEQQDIARKYMSSNNMYVVTTFNEWHEYTSIEPSVEYGFSYLEALKNNR